MQSLYLPEGNLWQTPNNKMYLSSLQGLEKAKSEGIILEAMVVSCDPSHNLLVDLAGIPGMIPREECALGIREGTTRDIAILSRVGKPVCFKIMQIEERENKPFLLLSRINAQQEAEAYIFQHKIPGDIISAKVTHLEPFGAFVDIGCGLISLIGIENISISRIFHPAERFLEGQNIHAVISHLDPELHRVSLTHKELLGTWEQNASHFSSGETVTGIVRSIEDYGIFIELCPNLSGLAEYRENVQVGQMAAVYIKSILPERMKIKLTIIHTSDILSKPLKEENYFLTNGHLQKWVYSPASCTCKYIATNFEAVLPH